MACREEEVVLGRGGGNVVNIKREGRGGGERGGGGLPSFSLSCYGGVGSQLKLAIESATDLRRKLHKHRC